MRTAFAALFISLFPTTSFALVFVAQGDQFTGSSVTLSNLSGGGTQCVQANNAGQITGTGAACGSGSGGGSLPLPAGATNYIQVSDTLQSGATFYTSSGTVTTLTAGVPTSAGSTYPLNVGGLAGMQIGSDGSAGPNTQIIFRAHRNNTTIGNMGIRMFNSSGGGAENLKPAGLYIDNGNNKDIVYINGNDDVDPSAFGDVLLQRGLILPTTGQLTLMDGNSSHFVALRAPDVVTSTYTLKFPASDGTDGQAIVTDGAGNLSFSNAGTSPLSGFYLKDSSNVAWKVYTSTTGVLLTTNVGSVPSGTLYRTSVVMQDASFAFWTVTVNTSGVLITTSGGSTAQTIQDILINDSTGFTWVYTVSTSGALTTS